MADENITVARPPEQVWQFLYEPNNEVLAERNVAQAFFVPGTALGKVGERRAQLRFIKRPHLRSLSCLVSEAVELDWGHHLALRHLSYRERPLRSITVEPHRRGSRVRIRTEMETSGLKKDEVRFSQQVNLVSQLRQIKKSIESDAPIPQRELAATARRARRLVRVITSEALDISVPTRQLWDLLADASSTLYNRQGSHAFVIPGTPVGQVGEINCALAPKGDLVLGSVSRIIEVEPGRRVVEELLSGRLPYAVTRVLGPRGDGCRLQLTTETLAPAKEVQQIRTSGQDMLRETFAVINEIVGNK